MLLGTIVLWTVCPMDPVIGVMVATFVLRACLSVLLIYIFALLDIFVLSVARKLGLVQPDFINLNLDNRPVTLACLVSSVLASIILASPAEYTYVLQDTIA